MTQQSTQCLPGDSQVAHCGPFHMHIRICIQTTPVTTRKCKLSYDLVLWLVTVVQALTAKKAIEPLCAWSVSASRRPGAQCQAIMYINRGLHWWQPSRHRLEPQSSWSSVAADLGCGRMGKALLPELGHWNFPEGFSGQPWVPVHLC